MSPEKQRIAIAKACGWKHEYGRTGRWITINPNGEVKQDAHKDIGKDWPLWYIPNYLNDLNAIHEAEKILFRYDRRRRYEELLLFICAGDKYPLPSNCMATAAQRAEASLKTLGLWEQTDEPPSLAIAREDSKKGDL